MARKEGNLFVRLEPTAKAEITALAKSIGMDQKDIASRLILWLKAQHPTARAVFLGQIDLSDLSNHDEFMSECLRRTKAHYKSPK